MYRLSAIRNTVQQTADAIASAIKIEVEIADDNLVRIAGTGQYAANCGEVMADGFVYKHVLAAGSAVVVEQPGFHPLCGPCPRRGRCTEDAEVAVPIKVDGQVIGVIGLISFESEQTRRLLDNRQSLLVFLAKMAELIAGKLLEYRQSEQREVLYRQLSTVLNLLDDAIVVVDPEGRITHSNSAAREAFLTSLQQDQPLLSEMFAGNELRQAVEHGETFTGHVFCKKNARRFLCQAVPIITSGQAGGAVLSLKDMQQVKKLVNHLTAPGAETSFSEILGSSKAIVTLKNMAAKVAQGSSTILLLGESGTGKEMFARAIHQSSPRRHQTFIAINCAAIPDNLLESELFGYEEGAFSGAKKGGKLGKLEFAQHGTIFLDEIGDMSLHLQAKLLRVLQERRIERVGGNHSQAIDVRVIAATNRNLEQLIETGEFREDLYYRLNVIPLYIPPLRERREDIPLLAGYFVDYYCRILGKEAMHLSVDAGDMLAAYAWPGNVRELANVIEYSVAMAGGSMIDIDCLPARVRKPTTAGEEKIYNLAELEKRTIIKALEYAEKELQSKGQVAQMLGISRASLYRKLKEYNIVEEVVYLQNQN